MALGAGSISLGSLQVARYCSDAVNVEFLRCFGAMLKEEERNLDLKIWNQKLTELLLMDISSLPSFSFLHRLIPIRIHICSMAIILFSFVALISNPPPQRNDPLNQGRVAVHRRRYISCSSEGKQFCRNIPLKKSKWVLGKMCFRLKQGQSILY